MIRVLHLPSCVGSNAWNLSIGEKKNGISSTVLINYGSIFGDDCDIKLSRSNWNVVDIIKYMKFCESVVNNYDIIHYNFGRPLIDYWKFWPLIGWDVKYFKSKGKKIVVTYQGDDARSPKYCLENYEITYFEKQSSIREFFIEKWKEKKKKLFANNADIIYATNPDLLNVLPNQTKYRPYTKLQPEEWVPKYSDYDKESMTIIHAPSDEKTKGTIYVDAAIMKLKNEGFRIDYIKIENLKNDIARKIYESADLVVDQLLVGFYGGFAVECMALGKPVMCYIREDDMKFIPAEMNNEMPIIRVDKFNIYDKLKYYIIHKKFLKSIAYESRKYVEKWHDPKKIAVKIIDDYKSIL